MTDAFVDTSYGHLDAKENQNIRALTADGKLKRLFYHEFTYNPGSLADAAGETKSETVSGVELGDMVLGVSAGVDLQDITVTAYVQAANTVEVRVQNESGGTIDLGSSTWRLLIADVT